jgi:tRNA threonylcarbamoyladenosine modification (KEOPS) complex  Pcc1 subunit
MEYRTEDEAKAIAKAVSPDNLSAPPGLRIRSFVEGSKVVTEIKCEKTFGTLLATVDDLLSCIQAAEKALRSVKERG